MGWGDERGARRPAGARAGSRRRRDRAERRRRARHPPAAAATRWRAARIAWPARRVVVWELASRELAVGDFKPIDWSRAGRRAAEARRDERPCVLVTGAAGEVGGGSCGDWRATAGACARWCCPAIRCARGSTGTGCEIARGRRPRRRDARRGGRPASTRSSTWPRSSWPATPTTTTRINRHGTANMVAAARGGGRAPLRLRLVGVGGLPAPHARTGSAKLDAEALVRRRAPVRAHHRAADAGLRRDGRAGVHAVPPLPAPVSGGARSSARARRASGRSSPTTSSTAWLASSATPICFGKTYNLSGAEPITLRELGKLMLRARRRAAAVPAPAGAAVPGARRRAGARHEESAAHPLRRRRLHQRRRSRLRRGHRATSGTRPRGVRAGLDRLLSQQPEPAPLPDRTPVELATARAPSAAFSPAAVDLAARAAPSPLAALALAAAAPPRAAARRAAARKSPTSESSKLMEEVGGKAKGIIVWSSSRLGNHDLFVMNTDGSNVHPITHGDAGRLVPALLARRQRASCSRRSKKGWVFERDANTDGKWDIYTVTPDGKRRDEDRRQRQLGDLDLERRDRLRARARRSCAASSATRTETRAGRQHEGARAGRRAAAAAGDVARTASYIAITLRGSKRETGIWNIAQEDLDAHRRGLPDQLDARQATRSTGSTPPATAAAGCCTCR